MAMNRVRGKSFLFSKAVLSCMFFLNITVDSYSQVNIECEKDLIVSKIFGRYTNDQLYWDGIIYDCSISPLHHFEGYDLIYIPESLFCSGSIEKWYMAYWTIIDNSLYLCNVEDVCSGREKILPRIEDYQAAFKEKRTFDDLFLIRLQPLEELIGSTFRKRLPTGIYPYPAGSGYVIAANWFNGTMQVKDCDTNIFTSYKQLTFKDGKLVSVRYLIYRGSSDLYSGCHH